MDRGNVDELFTQLGEVGPKIMELWGVDFLVVVDDEVPVDTHNLQWSIPANTEKGDWSWTIGTNVEYAPFVHEGHMTRPRTVHTKNYGSLKYGGSQRFIPGNPFFDRTLDTTESRLEDYRDQALEMIG